MSDGTIWLYPTDGNQEPRSLEGHQQMIVYLAFSPSGQLLVSGSLDRTARLWDVATGRLLHVFAGHKMGVSTAAFSVDETLLATGSWDATVRLWDLKMNTEMAVLGGHKAGVQPLVFAPDGRTLLVLGGTGLLKFWSLGALRECGEVRLSAGPGLGWIAVARSGETFGVAASSGECTLFEAPDTRAKISR
jgi:WD40 repeat protein